MHATENDVGNLRNGEYQSLERATGVRYTFRTFVQEVGKEGRWNEWKFERNYVKKPGIHLMQFHCHLLSFSCKQGSSEQETERHMCTHLSMTCSKVRILKSRGYWKRQANLSFVGTGIGCSNKCKMETKADFADKKQSLEIVYVISFSLWRGGVIVLDRPVLEYGSKSYVR